jgi:hypothetical protein
MYENKLDLQNLLAEVAWNFLVDDLLLTTENNIARPGRWSPSVSELLKDPTPEARLLWYRQNRATGALSENMYAFLVIREVDYLARKKLNADFQALRTSQLQLLHAQGLDELCEVMPVPDLDFREYVEACTKEWLQQFADMLRQYGEDHLAEMLTHSNDTLREMCEEGWDELYRMAGLPDGSNVPDVSANDFVAGLIAAMDVLVPPYGPNVQVAECEGGFMVYVVTRPMESESGERISAPLEFDLGAVCDEFDTVACMRWRTSEHGGIPPGFIMVGLFHGRKVTLRLCGILHPRIAEFMKPV